MLKFGLGWLLLSFAVIPLMYLDGPIKVGMVQNDPLAFVDADGHPKGIYVDVLDHIAERQGWELEYVDCQGDCLTMLEQGEIDLLVGVAVSEDGERFAYSNESLLSNWGQIYVRRNAGIQSILDLEQRSIALVRDEVYAPQFDLTLERFGLTANLIEVDDYAAVFEAVEKKGADAGLVPRLYGMRFESGYNVVRSPVVCCATELRFAVRSGTNQEILAAIDNHLVALKRNNESIYYESLERWLVGTRGWNFPTWLAWVFVGSGGLLLLFLGTNVVLRNQVRARTAELSNKNLELEVEVSERKRAEGALRHRTAEVQARNAELDAFAHTVAHDLKGPLASIVGYAEVVRKYSSSLPEEQVLEYVQEIGQSGRKMGNIIDELLLLAGVREEEVEPVPLDMAGIVAAVQERLSFMIEEHQAQVVSQENWPVALGHAPWVEEVWANYLSNALVYGGRPPRVELGATAPIDGMVRFWVRDNGRGIDPEEQSRLFTPFTRLSQVRTEGQGLGLSIVRRIVEKLGGTVGVESELGQGSLFFFTLPAGRPGLSSK